MTNHFKMRKPGIGRIVPYFHIKLTVHEIKDFFNPRQKNSTSF